MVTAGCEGALLEEAELHEGLKEVGGVGVVFEGVCSALRKLLEGLRGRSLAKAPSHEEEEEEEDSAGREGEVVEVRRTCRGLFSR